MSAPRWRVQEIASWTTRIVTGDATALPAYAEAAARWEVARELLAREPSPVHRADFRHLSAAVVKLQLRLGLPGAMTDQAGFLPGDPERLMSR